MYMTLVGKDGFRRGLTEYFKRHDGAAVTCDDFRPFLDPSKTFPGTFLQVPRSRATTSAQRWPMQTASTSPSSSGGTRRRARLSSPRPARTTPPPASTRSRCRKRARRRRGRRPRSRSISLWWWGCSTRRAAQRWAPLRAIRITTRIVVIEVIIKGGRLAHARAARSLADLHLRRATRAGRAVDLARLLGAGQASARARAHRRGARLSCGARP